MSGQKNDQDKIQLELLDPAFLMGVGEIMTFGAKKYAKYNWMEGIEASRLFGALMRHMWAFWDGEDMDPESGKPHLWHAGCCLMMLNRMFHNRPDLDDRPNFNGMVPSNYCHICGTTVKHDYLGMDKPAQCYCGELKNETTDSGK